MPFERRRGVCRWSSAPGLSTLAIGLVLVVLVGAWADATGSASARIARLTAARAAAAIRSYVRAAAPDADFPSAQGSYCPSSEIDATGQAVLCIVAYHVGSTWGSVGAEVSIVGGSLRIRSDWRGTWIRRWATCRTPGYWRGGGTLTSNNDCGERTFGGNDWYFLSMLGTPAGFGKFHFYPSRVTGWDWTNSAGYALGAYYLRHARGGTYTYSDVVGDSFRYQPARH
jgi:hypothetical protein